MQWLAGFFALLLKELLPSIITWVKDFFIGLNKSRTEAVAEQEYDKRVTQAVDTYKNAKTNEEQEDAFKNLISTARRH